MEQEDRLKNDCPNRPQSMFFNCPLQSIHAQNQERPQSLKFDVSEEESGPKGEERPGMKAARSVNSGKHTGGRKIRVWSLPVVRSALPDFQCVLCCMVLWQITCAEVCLPQRGCEAALLH